MVAALLRGQFGQQQRQFHVLKGGEHGNQIKGLKDVADLLIAPAGNLRVAKAENILPLHQQFALGDVDRHVIERRYLKGIALENLADAPNLYNFGARGKLRWCDCAHACPLILILSPSFNVGGAAVITLSPPTRPSTSAPSLRWPTTWISRATDFPL